MSAEIRRHQTTLICSGVAVIAFGLWSIVRSFLWLFFDNALVQNMIEEETRSGILTEISADSILTALYIAIAVFVLRSVEAHRWLCCCEARSGDCLPVLPEFRTGGNIPVLLWPAPLCGAEIYQCFPKNRDCLCAMMWRCRIGNFENIIPTKKSTADCR